MSEEPQQTPSETNDAFRKEAPKDAAAERAKSYEGTVDGLKQAARDLREERGAPDDAGPVRPPGPARSVTAEGAAKELGEWRKEQAEAAEKSAKDDFALKVDLARAGFNSSFEDLKTQEDINRLAAENPERFAEFQKHVIRTATQSEVQPETPVDAPTPGIDPELAEALQRPKVRGLIEAVAAGAEQQRQQSGQMIQAFADMARASLLQDHPELTGMTSAQFNGAMSMLARTDPAKHAAISHKVQLAMAGAQAIEQERLAKAQWEQQRFQQWSKDQDKAFEEKAPELADHAKRTRVSQAAVKTLHDVGFSDDELGTAWTGGGNISLRDHRAQLVIMKAALYDEARATAARNPSPKPIPPVLKPGVAPMDYDTDVGEIQNLRRELRGAKGERALKIAARLHGLQRAARG